MEVPYQSSQRVNQIIASLGRTEDVRFSPSGLRLAVAAFARNRIAVFDVEISASSAAPHIALTAAAELSSPALNRPHGVDFIDEDTLIVANREGGVAIFEAAGRQCPRGVGNPSDRDLASGRDSSFAIARVSEGSRHATGSV